MILLFGDNTRLLAADSQSGLAGSNVAVQMMTGWLVTPETDVSAGYRHATSSPSADNTDFEKQCASVNVLWSDRSIMSA